MLPAFGDLKGLAMKAVYLTGGGITARSVPQLFVPQYNTGFLGYGLNLLTTALSSAVVGKLRGPAASEPWLLGGFAFTVARIIEDYAGLQILRFAQYTPPFQLAGDASYGMAGIYATVSYPLPSDSLRALPPAALPAAVAPNGLNAHAGMGFGDGSFN